MNNRLFVPITIVSAVSVVMVFVLYRAYENDKKAAVDAKSEEVSPSESLPTHTIEYDGKKYEVKPGDTVKTGNTVIIVN